tara:strand:- start:202 stop:600 length:399 start_codon:yes stop_codon:yes gene_type:complete
MNKTETITPKTVLNLVQEELKLYNLKSKKRQRGYIQGRYIYFKLAKKFCRYASLSSIAEEVNRNHATVINGLKQYEIEAKYDSYMDDVYDKIYNKLDKRYIPPGRDTNYDMTFERILNRLEAVEIKLNKLSC